GYPGAEVPVLEDLTFTAQPGTTTAIIGATGSGKSTIVGLIPRLIDPQAGEVLIDGVPVSAFNRRQLAQLVGLVPQKPYLFSGT
ncbi:ATP-binding cassette domain-containing protein, partial [Escherichia coli]|uniref:ATP-binding cassette domain-containing protein n=3 Tax=Bacteria TaxID=2 RepID=UPI0028DE2A78